MLHPTPQVRAELKGGAGPWSDVATLNLSETLEPLIDTSSLSPNTSVPGVLTLTLTDIIPEMFLRPGIRLDLIFLRLNESDKMQFLCLLLGFLQFCMKRQNKTATCYSGFVLSKNLPSGLQAFE